MASKVKRVLPKSIKTLCGLNFQPGNGGVRSKVALWRGDITTLEFDAIVNAANASLLGGGGVDGAIHAAAGPLLYDECKKLNGCKTGEAKITKGYKLPAKHVIHTVGPQGEKSDKLQSCYKNSLDLMVHHRLRTIAFPCISTGIYGYPNESAANVALGTTRSWLEKNLEKVDLIVFCLFLEKDVNFYNKLVKTYFPEDSDDPVEGGNSTKRSVSDRDDAKFADPKKNHTDTLSEDKSAISKEPQQEDNPENILQKDGSYSDTGDPTKLVPPPRTDGEKNDTIEAPQSVQAEGKVQNEAKENLSTKIPAPNKTD